MCVTDDISDPSNVEKIKPTVLKRKTLIAFISLKSAPPPTSLETPIRTKLSAHINIPAGFCIRDSIQILVITTER